ncbi:MAG: S41 family peptidase [Caldisericia bacterium]|nr:S41 family peptidase [Caldisericia bacterium]
MEEMMIEPNPPQEKSNGGNKFLTAIIIILVAIFAFGIGIFSGILVNNSGTAIQNGKSYGQDLSQYKLLNEVIENAKNYYIKPLTEEDLSKSVLLGLDPYSVYFNAKEYQAFTEQTTGEYSGIGVIIQLDDNKRSIRVAQVFSPSPANDAGVQEGWIIHAINDEVLSTTDLEIVSSKIRGEIGTKVKIDFLSDGKTIQKTITRAKVEINSVSYKMIGNDVGYIYLSSFMTNSAQEMREAINNLELKGAKKFILDIRRDGGGLLKTCQDIGNIFIKSGVLVTVEDRNKVKRNLECAGPGFDYPLVLLVDKYSASASEILAGALQDHKIATLIGARTYGKGLVQNVIPMSNGGAMKITVQQYMRPSGKPVDYIGITPDIEVNIDENKPLPKDYKQDQAIMKALEVLGGKGE